jgi:hydrogenase 3 maturation protease
LRITIIIIGIGSDIRGDDAAPLRILDRLEKENLSGVKIIRAGTRPENFTEIIRRYNPTHILILQTGRWGGKPGEASFIQLDNTDGKSLHESPLTSLIHFLDPILNAKIRLLFTEPRSLIFGELTEDLKKAAVTISSEIIRSLSENNGFRLN